MARQTIVVDDLDGSDSGVATVPFSVDGVRYAIDLSAKNRKKFYDLLAPYVEHAQRIGRAETSHGGDRGRRGSGRDKRHLAEIRAWARAEGHEVSDRGRISVALQEAYDQAHRRRR